MFSSSLKQSLVDCKEKIDVVKSKSESLLRDILKDGNVVKLMQMLENSKKNFNKKAISQVEKRLGELLDEFENDLKSKELTMSLHLFLHQFWNWNNFVNNQGLNDSFYDHIAVLFNRLDAFLDEFFMPKNTSEEQLKLNDSNSTMLLMLLFDLKNKCGEYLHILMKKESETHKVINRIAILN
jgi:hypothetical protein